MYYRAEDHDDILCIFEEQTKLSSVMEQPYFLAQLIEDQNEKNHSAVFEVCLVHLLLKQVGFNIVFIIMVHYV